jgi:hypothetical protein
MNFSVIILLVEVVKDTVHRISNLRLRCVCRTPIPAIRIAVYRHTQKDPSVRHPPNAAKLFML